MKTIKLIMVTLFLSANLFVIAGDGGLKTGDQAPDFKLQNVDLSWISLSDYSQAKGAIVIFTCNHCPYAKAYENRIIELNNIYEPQGFPVIAINPNDPSVYEEDSFENMQIRAEDKGFTFPYLIDINQEVFPEYGATRTPHIFVLSNQDGFVVEYIGAIDDNYEDAANVEKTYVEDAVNALLQGQKPNITETKAIGCSIKVKK